MKKIIVSISVLVVIGVAIGFIYLNYFSDVLGYDKEISHYGISYFENYYGFNFPKDVKIEKSICYFMKNGVREIYTKLNINRKAYIGFINNLNSCNLSKHDLSNTNKSELVNQFNYLNRKYFESMGIKYSNIIDIYSKLIPITIVNDNGEAAGAAREYFAVFCSEDNDLMSVYLCKAELN